MTLTSGNAFSGMLAILGLGTCVPAVAAPKAVYMPNFFRNLAASDVKLEKGRQPCAVRVASIIDQRSDPTVIGMLDRKPIYSPQNIGDWNASVVRALKSRSFVISMPEAPPSSETLLTGDFEIVSIWLTWTHGNVASNAVFKIRLAGPNGATMGKQFRGTIAKINWGSGTDEMINAVEGSISKALDAMAVDMHAFCEQAKTAAPI